MKFPKIPALLAAIVMSTSPIAGQAQDRSLMCGAMDDLEQFGNLMYTFLGQWNAHHLSGFVTMGPMMIPFPADNEIEVLNFEQDGERMFITHPEMQQPMELKIPGEPVWRFVEYDAESGIPAPTLTSEDIEMVMNCDIEEMPRLIGRTSATVDGMTMDFVWRILLMDFENMYVIQHVSGIVQGMPFFSRRTVSLSRTSNWEQPPLPEDETMDFTVEEEMDFTND